jgi:hypothetical protein
MDGMDAVITIMAILAIWAGAMAFYWFLRLCHAIYKLFGRGF